MVNTNRTLMFSMMSIENRMNSRSYACKDMHIPAVRSEITKQGLRYKAVYLYNRINKTKNWYISPQFKKIFF